MDHQSTILIVDDYPDNIKVLVGLLKQQYRTKVATGGEKALLLASQDPAPDLILLDIMMPDMDGYEVCRRLKAEEKTRDIPVIFLSAMSETMDEVHGFDAGAVDYITKPISPPVVWARVKTHLQLKEARSFLRSQNEILEHKVQERTRRLNAIQDVTMLAMGSLAEARDNETGNHIRRTQKYIQILAQGLKDHPRFHDMLTPEYMALLLKSAPLHDVGKIGIPDAILLKPGRLSAEEFTVMKEHTLIGGDAILNAERILDEPESFLRIAREIAYSHHEKWDGSGYPEGLKGDAIPVSARLMALADVYDALITARIYKPAFGREQTENIIFEGRGVHFDPDVVDVFLSRVDEFFDVSERFKDSESQADLILKRQLRGQ